MHRHRCNHLQQLQLPVRQLQQQQDATAEGRTMGLFAVEDASRRPQFRAVRVQGQAFWACGLPGVRRGACGQLLPLAGRGTVLPQRLPEVAL